MKKLLFVLSIMCSVNTQAQDVIVKKDGSTILSKVLEVNPADIKYKKYSSQNGPTYTINKSEVMSINYENGDSDKFNEKEQIASQQQTSGGIAKPLEPANSAHIEFYNKRDAGFIPKKSNNKKADCWIGFLGIDECSVMASDKLEASIFQRIGGCLLNSDEFHLHPFNGHFYIQLENKTNKTLYIDLGNTFRVDDSGCYKVYYDTKQITITHGSGNGAGLNVGSVASVLGIGGTVGTLANGVNVGTNKTNSSSTTYSMQRIIAIPPKGKTILEQCEYEQVKGIKLYKLENFVYRSYCEGFNYTPLSVNVKNGEQKNYSFIDSPRTYRYTITYSEAEDFNTWEALTVNAYIKSLMGGIDIYKSSIDKVKKSISNYDSGTIIIGGRVL